MKYSALDELSQDYGIYSTADILEYLTPKLLIDKIREEFSNSEDDVENPEFSLENRYACAVGNSMGFRGPKLRTFMFIRMSKMWSWANPETIKIIHSRLGDLIEAGGVWGITRDTLRHAWKAGLTINKTCDLIHILANTWFNDAVNMAVVNGQHRYSTGTHTGEMVAYFMCRVRHNHNRHINTFLQVSKISSKISTSPVSSKYLRVLEGLPKDKFFFTLTDTRNWLVKIEGAGWESRYFRLKVIPNSMHEWHPLRLNHKRDKMWLTQFGRKPTNRSIYMFPTELVENFTKKSFGFFVRETKRLEILTEDSNHEVMALAKLIVWFGKNYGSYVSSCGIDIHDAGINLPVKPFQDGVKFLRRYTHRQDDAQRILSNWEYCLTNGVNPLGKNGLALAHNLCKALVYDNVQDIDFAKECAKWVIDQKDFELWQAMWNGRNNVTYESIPKPIVSQGDWKFYRLDRDDPRGLFLGHYTNCCQHPDGAGSSCAWQGVLNPNSTFVVLEYRGEIKFQSWVWRFEDTLVFDNIEGGCKPELMEDAEKMYIKGVNSFRGNFGINTLYVGTGRSDIELDLPLKQNPLDSPANYTDARTVWEITGE